MAIQYDELDDHHVIADDPSLTLQNGDWCVGIWTRINDTTGTAFQYLISTGAYGVNPSINAYMDESAGGASVAWYLNVNGLEIITTTLYAGDGTDRLLIFQRRSGTLEIIVCDAFGTASQQASTTLSAASDAGAWNIGRRFDANADRYYGGVAGEFFKGDFSLSLDEVTALGGGLKITQLNKALDVYLPMESAEATLIDLIGSNDATRVSVPTTVEHFPLYDGQPQFVSYSVATGVITLTIAGCTHSVAVDSPTLVQANTLALADTSHANAVDNVGLTQANILELADTLHAHSVDSPALVQANTITVADALHSNTIDNITLDVALTLVVSDTTHAVGVDNIALTQANLLVVQNVLHSVGVDNVVLTQANTLVVSDTLHSALVDSILLSVDTGAITPLERIFLITAEDRTFIIAGEDRVLLIDSEDRIFKVTR